MSISDVWNHLTTFSHPDFFPTRNSNLDAALAGEYILTLKNEYVISQLDCFTYCNSRSSHWEAFSQPNIHLFKVNNRNTRARCKIRWKLTIKTPEQSHWLLCNVFVSNDVIRGVFFVSFEHISSLVLVFLLLTLNRWLPAWWSYEKSYFSVSFQVVASGLYNSVLVSM